MRADHINNYMIYLYVKQHNKTGLRYLGKTQQDPFKYRGSGKRWINHLKKHGNDVTTTIIGSFVSNEDLKLKSIQLSEEWDIVNSDEWANLKVEAGDGGPSPYNIEHLRSIASLGGKARALKGYSAWNKGKTTPRTKESIEKQKNTMTGKKRGPYKNYNYGPPIEFNGTVYKSIQAARDDTKCSFYTIKRQMRILEPNSEPSLS